MFTDAIRSLQSASHSPSYAHLCSLHPAEHALSNLSRLRASRSDAPQSLVQEPSTSPGLPSCFGAHLARQLSGHCGGAFSLSLSAHSLQAHGQVVIDSCPPSTVPSLTTGAVASHGTVTPSIKLSHLPLIFQQLGTIIKPHV